MFQCSKKKENKFTQEGWLPKEEMFLLFRFWSSKSLFAILSSYNTLSIFRVCYGLQVLCTSDKAQFLQFLILSFYYLGLPSALKALTNLFGCCSRTVTVLLLFVLLSIFAPLYYTLLISLAWIKPSLMSLELIQRLLLLLFHVRLSQVNC